MKDFKDLCNSRFSVRKFKTEDVPMDLMNYVMECVRLAPSACDKQPWKFVCVNNDEERMRVQECYERPWFKLAPVYVIACAVKDEAWVRPDDGKNHGDIDVAIAVEHLCLAAADAGLGTCWVCNFDVEKLRHNFAFPQGWEPVAIVPLGFPDCEPTPKKRKENGDIWLNSLQLH